MNPYTWLLDAGHGGLKSGLYTTAPAKMHQFPDGLTYYEGVGNRMLVNRLGAKLREAEIPILHIHDPEDDTPLRERVKRANEFYEKDKHCLYLSIHSDAMPDGAHGKGSGFSVFTARNTTEGNRISDVLAAVFQKTYAIRFPEHRTRMKQDNFYVLRNTRCPAILVENLFFDNRREAEFLLSEAGQEEIADTMFNAIRNVEKLISLCDHSK